MEAARKRWPFDSEGCCCGCGGSGRRVPPAVFTPCPFSQRPFTALFRFMSSALSDPNHRRLAATGSTVNRAVGAAVGVGEGAGVGAVGAAVGQHVGIWEGRVVGLGVGARDGHVVGSGVGPAEGKGEGSGDGTAVGVAVGSP